MQFPGRDGAVLARATRYFDHARRPRIRPRELLFARPDDLDRLARGLGQPRGFDGGFTAVLPAVTRSGVGDDHAHALFGNPERDGQLLAHAEGALRAGPDGQFVPVPFGQRSSRLERHVRDVGDGVRLR